MQRVTSKTSTVFIGLGKDTLVYRSMAEVPPSLRKKLRDSMQHSNSVTIVIADKRGRQELERAAKRLTGAVVPSQPRTRPSLQAVTCAENKSLQARAVWRNWLELLVPIAIGVALWLLIDSN